jgi:hypothetical protein
VCHLKRVASSAAAVVVPVMKPIEVAGKCKENEEAASKQVCLKGPHILHSSYRIFEYKWNYNGAIDPLFTDCKPIVLLGWRCYVIFSIFILRILYG